MLGIAASWIVQVGVRIFQFFATKSRNEDGGINKAERNRIFNEKVFLATLRCNASLIFASIGGGIGATLIRPSIGQWIGKIIYKLFKHYQKNLRFFYTFFFFVKPKVMQSALPR